MRIVKISAFLLILPAFLAGPIVQSARAEEPGREGRDALMQELREFLQVSTARYAGMPGNYELEEKVAARFAESGFENGEIKFRAPSFVPGKTTLTITGRYASTYTLQPLHPTLVRPGNFKEREFVAPLVYLGQGTPEDLDRLSGTGLEGAIGVMEFECGDSWLNFMRLGLRGFIFIGAGDYWYKDVEQKLYNTEVSVPRFFLSGGGGQKLKAFLSAAEPPAEGKIAAEPSRWTTRMVCWIVLKSSK